MKAVFYKSILKDKNLSPTDMIIFCQILYLSLTEKESAVFTSDGEFDTSPILEENNGYIELSERASIKYLSGMINPKHKIASMKQCYLSLTILRNLGYITNNEYGSDMVKLITMKPFFELKIDTGLRGLELIIYSYLVNKESITKRKDKWIDKFHKAIAEDLFLPMSADKKNSKSLERILSRLAKKGYLERSRRGSYRVWLRTTTPQK